MTGLMIIAAVVVAMAVAMGSKKNNGKFLGFKYFNVVR